MILNNITNISNVRLGNIAQKVQYIRLINFTKREDSTYPAFSKLDFVVDGEPYDIGAHISTSVKGSSVGFTDYTNIRVDGSGMYIHKSAYDMRNTLLRSNFQTTYPYVILEPSTLPTSVILVDFKKGVNLEGFSMISTVASNDNTRHILGFTYELLDSNMNVIEEVTVPSIHTPLGERRHIAL